jgi:hypothetical protein
MDINRKTADIKDRVDKKAANIKTKVGIANEKIRRIKIKGRRIINAFKE